MQTNQPNSQPTNQLPVQANCANQLTDPLSMASQPSAASHLGDDQHYRTLEDIVLTSQEAKEWLARSIVCFTTRKDENPHKCLTLALDVHEACKAVKTFEPCKYTMNMMAHPKFQTAILVVDQHADDVLLGQLRKRVVFEAKFRVSADRLKRQNYLDLFA